MNTVHSNLDKGIFISDCDYPCSLNYNTQKQMSSDIVDQYREMIKNNTGTRLIQLSSNIS